MNFSEGILDIMYAQLRFYNNLLSSDELKKK
jgi:hypothetical protein